MSIKNRKKEHVELTIHDGTQYDTATGFDHIQFKHNALPEVNIEDISTEALLLNRNFDFPLFISSMTGGYSGATAVNSLIAEFCEINNLPFGVGSQRAMIDHPEETKSFKSARKSAPNAFIAANIGGVQLVNGIPDELVSRLIDSIEANAIIIHLNPLQELMQPEGDRVFKGVRSGIEQLISKSKVPVIVKETGAGISKEVASILIDAGVSVIDIAGAGGTSWAKVENQRKINQNPNNEFDNWGIPTLQSLREVSELKWENSFELIASGGIRSASDIAKSLCLGANFTAMAQPIIKVITESGLDGLQSYYDQLKMNFTYILCLLGCDNIDQLNTSKLYS